MLRDNNSAIIREAPDFELPTWESCTAALADVYREATAATMQRPLRIAQIITTLTTGGAERQLQSVVSHSLHHHRTIALYGGGAVADDMRRAGAHVDVLGMAGWRKPLAILRLAYRLRRMKPDVVHVHLLSGQLWGIPAARLAGIRTIVSTEHSLMESTIEGRPLTVVLGRLYRALERLALETVAVSTTTRSRLIRWGIPAERISVIPNGIDFGLLAYSATARQSRRAEFGIDPQTELLGAVGRLEPVKRFLELLAAVAPTLQPGVRELMVVGDGPLRDELEQLAAELDVADCVHLTGPRTDVPALMAAMDVLISPSRDETFGMAVLEGLGAGLPVVYAQCPALEELGERPAWAFPMTAADGSDTADSSDAAERAEAESIRHWVTSAIDAGAAGRFPLPIALSKAYGIERTAGALDDLYRELVTVPAGTETRT